MGRQLTVLQSRDAPIFETKRPVRPFAELPFQGFLLFDFKLAVPFPKSKF